MSINENDYENEANIAEPRIIKEQQKKNNSFVSIFSDKYHFRLTIIFYVFGLMCNGAGYYFSSIPPSGINGQISTPFTVCHFITGIGFCINAMCALYAFSSKKYLIANTLATLFTGFILFPTIMLTASDPNETIMYQFILPMLYALILTKKTLVQTVLSSVNSIFLVIIDYHQFTRFENIKISHAINMTIVFAVIYFTAMIIMISFAKALTESLDNEILLRNKYKNIARKDPLTKLYNRFGLSEILDDTKKCYAIMVDIDHFKYVNDTYTHQVGDSILVALADILKSYAIDGRFLVSRYGGEEFLLISYLDEDDTINKCRAIKEMVSKKITTPKDEHITISMGVSNQNVFSESLIRDADICLYLSKSNGRDKITYSWLKNN